MLPHGSIGVGVGVRGMEEADRSPTGADPALPSHSAKKRLFSASLWSLVASTAGQMGSFLIFVVLARLLTPTDFGTVAFLAIFIDITRGVIVGGIPEALIQRSEWSARAANTAFWLNMSGALGFAMLTLAAAVGLEVAGSGSAMAWLFAGLSLTLVLDAARAVHEAHLRRHFQYKLLAKRTIVATLIGGLAGVGSALVGLGMWALVVQRLVSAGTQTAILWQSSPYRPDLSFERGEVRPLLTFSSQAMAGRLLGQMNARLPDFVIGFVAGPAALGLFRVASRSLNFLVQSLIMPLQVTTLSTFARLKDRAAVGRAYGRYTQVTALITFPAFFGAAAIAPDFMRVCFGERWLESAPIMAVLAFAVVPRTLLYFFQPAMQAIGLPRRTIAPELRRMGSGAVVVTLCAFAGPLAAAAGDTARHYWSLPQSLRIIHRELGTRPASLMRGISRPMVCSLLMLLSLVLLQFTLLKGWAPLPRLVVCVASGGVLYALLLGLLARAFLVDVLGSARDGLPGRARVVADRLIRWSTPKSPASAVA